MAVNISTSARKLFRNDQNFEFSSGLFSSCSFLSMILFCFYIGLPNLAAFSEH